MMWNLNDYKRAFYAVGLIGIIICFAPSFVKIARSPPMQEFSEIYALGNSTLPMIEDYPFNVSAGGSYLVHLGVGNHMGSSMYYEVDVKFRNASDSFPNGAVPSTLPVLYDYRVFLEDGQVWEGNLTFSFSGIVINKSENSCSIGKIRVNDVEFGINKTAAWDNANSGFYYQLLVELWRYNQANDGLLYNTFVGLWLNMTSIA